MPHDFNRRVGDLNTLQHITIYYDNIMKVEQLLNMSDEHTRDISVWLLWLLTSLE